MVKDLNDPTNVDTVPAMLTEGEFVLNKEATQMFGPIIEEMNRAGLLQRDQENQMVQANAGAYVSSGYNTGGLVNFLKKEEGYKDKAYQDQRASGQSVTAGLRILMAHRFDQAKPQAKKKKTAGSSSVPPMSVPPLTSTQRSTGTTGRKDRKMPLPPLDITLEI